MGTMFDAALERAGKFPAKPLEVGERYTVTGETFEVLAVGRRRYFIRWISGDDAGHEGVMLVAGTLASNCKPAPKAVDRWMFAVVNDSGASFVIERTSEAAAVRHRENYARVPGQAVSPIVFVRFELKAEG